MPTRASVPPDETADAVDRAALLVRRDGRHRAHEPRADAGNLCAGAPLPLPVEGAKAIGRGLGARPVRV